MSGGLNRSHDSGGGGHWRLRARSAIAVAVLVAASAPVAMAQSVAPVRHLELSIGGGVLGGAHAGDQPAIVRAGGTGEPFRLFDTQTDIAASAAIEGRVGILLTRLFGVEARAALGRPELRTRVSADVEGAPDATLTERVASLTIDGGAIVRFDALTIGSLTPFLAGGGGFVNYLHEGEALFEDAPVFYAGGGVARGFRDRPDSRLRTLGLRVDARVYILPGNDSISDGGRQQAAVTASVVFVF